jgi:hypothetical protein
MDAETVERDSNGISAGFGIVMTDLFISATAALLMVLAVMRNHPPTPVPLQADILARCENGEGANPVLVMSKQGGDARFTIGKPEDLGAVPALLGLPARMIYMISLESGPDTPLATQCLRWAKFGIVKSWNDLLRDTPEDAPASHAIFMIAPVTPEQTGQTGNE